MNGRMMHTVVAIGIGLMISAASMAAQPGHRGHGPGGGGMGPLEALDLTDAQKDQIKALHEQFKADHEDEFEQMKTLHGQMREQRQAGDREGAQAIREQLHALRQSMKADHEALRERIDAILTAEQRAKLEEMKANHPKGDCKGKRGKRGDKGNRGEGETGTNTTPPSIN